MIEIRWIQIGGPTLEQQRLPVTTESGRKRKSVCRTSREPIGGHEGGCRRQLIKQKQLWNSVCGFWINIGRGATVNHKAAVHANGWRVTVAVYRSKSIQVATHQARGLRFEIKEIDLCRVGGRRLRQVRHPTSAGAELKSRFAGRITRSDYRVRS